MPEFDWDPQKDAENIANHGVGFAALDRFKRDLATFEVDDRDDYGELRGKAVSFLGDIPHVLIFTERAGVIRAINLRKATKQVPRRYVEATK